MTWKGSPCGTFARDLPFGAAFDAQRGTTFRLWAPSQPCVLVEMDGGGIVPMSRQSDGVFEGRVDCQPGTCYRYRLASGESIPDPASRAQIDDVHGFSVVVDPRAYQWKYPDWRGRPWHETIIYELHVGACGDFLGVAEKVPNLAALGITAIELMPINDFPGKRN